jgi:hypothetical protein
VSPLHTLARAEISAAIEVGTGCARKGAGRMPDQANLAQGNPNSMPQKVTSAKSLIRLPFARPNIDLFVRLGDFFDENSTFEPCDDLSRPHRHRRQEDGHHHT